MIKDFNMTYTSISKSQTIYVSLSSVPSRISYIKPTIDSILNQSIQPNKLFVVIPYYSRREKKKYIIPSFLTNNKNITLLRSRKDWGPATKLLPVLKITENLNTLILTIDDDRIYDKDMIKDYLKYADKYPDSILGRRGWVLKRPHFQWPIFSLFTNSTKIKKPIKVDVLTGVGSVLYRKKLVPLDVFKYEKSPKECFFNDDIWFSGNLAKHKIDRFVIPTTVRLWHHTNKTSYPDPTNKNSIHRKALWNINKNGINNNKIIKHFLPFWGATKEELLLNQYYFNQEYTKLINLLKSINLDLIDELFIYNCAEYIRKYSNESAMDLYQYLVKNSSRKFKGLSFFHLGNISYKFGDTKKSKEYFKKCIRLIPDHKSANKKIKQIK